VLTKRAERMHELMQSLTLDECLNAAGLAPDFLPTWPPQNLWLGVSVEDQQRADERIPLLMQTPAALRYLSLEPLLGPVDLSKWLLCHCSAETGHCDPCLQGCPKWAIVGGESGDRARPMHPNWVRSLRDQCKFSRLSFFFKQWGEWAPWEGAGVGVPSIEARRINDTGQDITSIPELHCGDEQVTDAYVYRVGKKAAGRELDGRTWDEMPRGAGA